ncbi:MAG: hypothetical protein HS111_09715 [Kofleriaceae bacterium]|nr:hypothetical protein [Kofleriaceae bacterium]
MIEFMDDDRIGVRCAMCNEARDVRLQGVEVRTLSSVTAIVALPSCACGAIEFLVRAPRVATEILGGDTHRHQLLVDHLHATLARRGRVARDSKDAEKVCPPVPDAVLARWFPDGLKLGGGEVVADVVSDE